MRPFRIAILAIVTIVGLLLAVAALAYLSDYTVEATVESRQCFGTLSGQPNTVTVETKMFAIRYTMEGIPDTQCGLVDEGNYVQYRIRSNRVSLYRSEGGSCIYDSEGGVGGCSS